MTINISCFLIMCKGKCSYGMRGPTDDNDYNQEHLVGQWDGTHHIYIDCPCMGTASRLEECCVVQPTCLNVIHHHSLFILPPSSLHAKANLILGLLIVGAFSQAFFQFTSISSSHCASRLPSQKGKKFLLWGSWFETGWHVPPPPPPSLPAPFLLSLFDELLFPS